MEQLSRDRVNSTQYSKQSIEQNSRAIEQTSRAEQLSRHKVYNSTVQLKAQSNSDKIEYSTAQSTEQI